MALQYRMAVSSADDAPKTAPLLLLGSIRDNLIQAAKLGYDAIEIHTRENAKIDFGEIEETFREYNVGVSAVVSGRLAVQENISITDADDASVQRAVLGLLSYIELAHKLKTDLIIGWIRGKAYKGAKEYYGTLARNLKPVAERAADKNVKILIEAINRYEIDTCNTAKETLAFIEDYALCNVYVHLDTFHMNIEEADMQKAILDCGDKLGYIHFADSNRLYPGAGHIDFKAIINALDKIRYKGYVSVECLPHPDGLTAAKNAIEYVKLL